jgi:hypothetical protein
MERAASWKGADDFQLPALRTIKGERKKRRKTKIKKNRFQEALFKSGRKFFDE